MLTKTKREALTRARAMVKRCEEDFICNALDTVKMKYPRLRPACVSLKKYIERMLDGHVALGSWQKANVDPLSNARSTSGMRRADRLMWIDWMLGWEHHRGGECPATFTADMKVTVRCRNGDEFTDDCPTLWRWEHASVGDRIQWDIVAYRIEPVKKC